MKRETYVPCLEGQKCAETQQHPFYNIDGPFKVCAVNGVADTDKPMYNSIIIRHLVL